MGNKNSKQVAPLPAAPEEKKELVSQDEKQQVQAVPEPKKKGWSLFGRRKDKQVVPTDNSLEAKTEMGKKSGAEVNAVSEKKEEPVSQDEKQQDKDVTEHKQKRWSLFGRRKDKQVAKQPINKSEEKRKTKEEENKAQPDANTVQKPGRWWQFKSKRVAKVSEGNNQEGKVDEAKPLLTEHARKEDEGDNENDEVDDEVDEGDESDDKGDEEPEQPVKRYTEEQAALKIQSLQRGRSARRLARERKNAQIEAASAASQKECEEQKRIEGKASIVPIVPALPAAKSGRYTEEQAALKIQSLQRGRSARLATKELKANAQNQKAIKDQAKTANASKPDEKVRQSLSRRDSSNKKTDINAENASLAARVKKLEMMLKNSNDEIRQRDGALKDAKAECDKMALRMQSSQIEFADKLNHSDNEARAWQTKYESLEKEHMSLKNTVLDNSPMEATVLKQQLSKLQIELAMLKEGSFAKGTASQAPPVSDASSKEVLVLKQRVSELEHMLASASLKGDLLAKDKHTASLDVSRQKEVEILKLRVAELETERAVAAASDKLKVELAAGEAAAAKKRIDELESEVLARRAAALTQAPKISDLKLEDYEQKCRQLEKEKSRRVEWRHKCKRVEKRLELEKLRLLDLKVELDRRLERDVFPSYYKDDRDGYYRHETSRDYRRDYSRSSSLERQDHRRTRSRRSRPRSRSQSRSRSSDRPRLRSSRERRR